MFMNWHHFLPFPLFPSVVIITVNRLQAKAICYTYFLFIAVCVIQICLTSTSYVYVPPIIQTPVMVVTYVPRKIQQNNHLGCFHCKLEIINISKRYCYQVDCIYFSFSYMSHKAGRLAKLFRAWCSKCHGHKFLVHSN